MRDKSEEPSNRIHKLKYKAIGFDTDDTLYDFQCAMRRSLGFTLDRILERMPDCDLTVDKMIGIRNQVAEEMKGKARDFEEIRLKAFERTLQYCGICDYRFARALNVIYFRNRFDKAGFFEDVFPVLEQLKDRYVLGVISNGNTYPKKCARVEYSQSVKGVVEPVWVEVLNAAYEE